jgi:hypothetical protein
MGMTGSFITINTIQIPGTDDFGISSENVGTTTRTEAGTKSRDMVRYGVRAYRYSNILTTYWKEQLFALSKEDTVTVTAEGLGTASGVPMFIENFDVKLQKGTRSAFSGSALWKVSFDLVEV